MAPCNGEESIDRTASLASVRRVPIGGYSPADGDSDGQSVACRRPWSRHVLNVHRLWCVGVRMSWSLIDMDSRGMTSKAAERMSVIIAIVVQVFIRTRCGHDKYLERERHVPLQLTQSIRVSSRSEWTNDNDGRTTLLVRLSCYFHCNTRACLTTDEICRRKKRWQNESLSKLILHE
jgi:hypothetical protein